MPFTLNLRILEIEVKVRLAHIPDYCSHNAHMFYLVCRNLNERNRLLDYLNGLGINAIFHYLPLHKSIFYSTKYTGDELGMCDHYADCLIRLPFYFELTVDEVQYISEKIVVFYGAKN